MSAHKPQPSLVWFRLDLRLTDNPALHAALDRKARVIPVFIWSPEEEGEWPAGGASCWWLHQSLSRLKAALHEAGARLIIRRGPSLSELQGLIRETRANAVFWNRRYEPAAVHRDRVVENELRSQGCEVQTFNGNLLFDPWKIQNKSGKPFKVFTAFWRHCLSGLDPQESLPSARNLAGSAAGIESLSIEALELEPKINWASGISAVWQPGEKGAQRLLNTFCDRKISGYRTGRDRPDQEGTSRLSPHLHFGEISPRQIWHALRNRAKEHGLNDHWRNSPFVTELGWREFAHHLLCSFPKTPTRALRPEFDKFPWRADKVGLKAWQQGKTGFPLVDAGMRELWTTGWMHNRVRMVVASFLVKDLLIPWQEGAKWFWDTLVDADLANNTLGWQWTAGCGADAAPFFRIFNPVSQGEKFDPEGEYVRKWVPELRHMPRRWVHCPWQAPREVLKEAGVELGRTYPKPVVDHGVAREKALEAFAQTKSKNP